MEEKEVNSQEYQDKYDVYYFYHIFIFALLLKSLFLILMHELAQAPEKYT